MKYLSKSLLVLSFAVALILPSVSHGASLGELQAQINALLAQVQLLQQQLAQMQGEGTFHDKDTVRAVVGLKVRQSPLTNGAVVTVVPTGSTGTIRCDLGQDSAPDNGTGSHPRLECPTTADGYTWWYVQWNSPSIAGWSAEGSSEAKFLIKTSDVTTSPIVNSILPVSGPVGTQVTIYGSGFGSDPTLRFGGATVSALSHVDTSATFLVPEYITPCRGNPYMDIACPQVVKQVTPGQYQISVGVVNSGNYMESNSVTFTVTSGVVTSTSTITVTSPNGGETWTKSTPRTIKWQDSIPSPTSCAVGPSGSIAEYCPQSTQPSQSKLYDIKLVPYDSYPPPPCTTGNSVTCAITSYPVHVPYIIASSVSGNSFSWSVGKVTNTTGSYGGSDMAPDGSYTVQVCRAGTSTCDSSDSYFKIVGGITTNNSPVINGIPAVPVGAKVGQSTSFGWGATDADGDNLAWSVSWGDGSGVAGACQSPNPQNEQNWTLNTSHAWQNAGTYTIKATVSDCRGGSDEYVFSVSIGDSIQPLITVLSPNGGETWTKGTTQIIKWQDNTPIPLCPAGAACSSPAPKYYDIKLVTYYPPCTGNVCPSYSYVAPYTVANNVYGSSYSWSVGKIVNTYGGGDTAPDGLYTVQICQAASTTCDTSDSYFKIVSGVVIPTAPAISFVSPSSGPVGTQVTITGSGFTLGSPSGCEGTTYPYACDQFLIGTNTINFGPTTISNVFSTDNKTLTFSVPESYSPLCSTGLSCPAIMGIINPGIYNVFVTNTNGISNGVTFTVTSGTLCTVEPACVKAGLCEVAIPPGGWCSTSQAPTVSNLASLLDSMKSLLEAMSLKLSGL